MLPRFPLLSSSLLLSFPSSSSPPPLPLLHDNERGLSAVDQAREDPAHLLHAALAQHVVQQPRARRGLLRRRRARRTAHLPAQSVQQQPNRNDKDNKNYNKLLVL